jgi:hypothetical protein
MVRRFAFSALALVATAKLVACGSDTAATLDGQDAGPPPNAGDGAVFDDDAAAFDDDAGPPEPATGGGIWEPRTNTLHDYGCAGLDWQIMNHWIVIAHKAPEVGDRAQIQRCADRYAGWVTHEADAAKVSRASIYAALEASGACDTNATYAGIKLAAGLCAKLRPQLSAADCAAQLQTDAGFGVKLTADALASASLLAKHRRDPVLMGAVLGQGTVACGGADRWKVTAPAGWLDRYARAYNTSRELQEGEAAPCGKRLVATFALYTGLADPGAAGAPASNACWTYERVSKDNPEWKLCNYDGTVHHPGGSKWAYDDTNSNHSAATESARIAACRSGVPGRGYIDMTNRGSGWASGSATGVRAHFAELYSSQFTVDDQFGAWLADGKPGGAPMLNFGEPVASAKVIGDETLRVCKQVASGGFLGVYLYPLALSGARLAAFVSAMNACTAP